MPLYDLPRARRTPQRLQSLDFGNLPISASSAGVLIHTGAHYIPFLSSYNSGLYYEQTSTPQLPLTKMTTQHTLSTAELQELYNFALDLGRRAGKILLDGVEKRCAEQSSGGGREAEAEAQEKMNAVDIVTQTDLGRYLYHFRIPYPEVFSIATYEYRSGRIREQRGRMKWYIFRQMCIL